MDPAHAIATVEVHDPEALIPLARAAGLLGVSVTTVERRVAAGVIALYSTGSGRGHRRLVRRGDVLRLLETMRVPGTVIRA